MGLWGWGVWEKFKVSVKVGVNTRDLKLKSLEVKPHKHRETLLSGKHTAENPRCGPISAKSSSKRVDAASHGVSLALFSPKVVVFILLLEP